MRDYEYHPDPARADSEDNPPRPETVFLESGIVLATALLLAVICEAMLRWGVLG